jgi:hypothetical protein
MPFFSSLDYDHGADHLSGCGYVDQEDFSRSGGHQDGRVGKECLKVSEGFLGLGGPSEALGLLKRRYRGKPFSPRREMKRLRAARHPMTLCIPFKSLIGPMLVMAAIFSGLALMPCSETMNPRSMPRGTPKTHFLGLSFTPFRSQTLECRL